MTTPRALALRYLRAGRSRVHLDPTTKTRINRAFHKVGLDGNMRFVEPQRGYSAAVEVLQQFDVELAEIANSFVFTQPQGRLRLDLAFTNTEDSFSPIPIVNASLTVTFYRRDEDNYEVVAYVA